MHLIKSGIHSEDKKLALRIINKLKSGNRVFGIPAQNLKITLQNKEKEEQHRKSLLDKNIYYDEQELQYNRIIGNIKAGIVGEEELGQYIQKLIQINPSFQDFIFFASLADPNFNQGHEQYISDTDFICVYGNHLLLIDAKNISTTQSQVLRIDMSNNLCKTTGEVLMHLNSGIGVWKKIFMRVNQQIDSITSVAVVINNNGTIILRDNVWMQARIKPLYINEFADYLVAWMKYKTPIVRLSLLISLAKLQIKKDNISHTNKNKFSKLF